MRLIEINRNPTDRQLRQFGLIALVALPLVAWLWGGGRVTIGTCALVGLAVAAVGIAFPRALKPLFVGLSLITIPIGLVVGEAAMLLIFYAVFLPMGLCFRLMGRDPLQLRFDRQTKTYWQPKQQPSGPASYFRLW
jgi:hypothetical protein